MASYSLETVLTSIFMITVSVLAVTGNFLVIVAILWNRKLRTVYNFLFLNLAVADILQGAIAMPLRLADQLNQTDNRPLIPCLVVIPLTIFLFGASNFNLTLISLDRYLALTRPFLYSTFAEPRIVAFTIAVSWVLIFIIAVLPIMGWGAADTAEVADICLYSTTLNKEYLLMLFSIVNLAVTIVLVFTNYFILQTTRKQIREINVINSHGSIITDVSSITVVPIRSFAERDTTDTRARVPRPGGSKERRATKIVLIIVGIFVLFTTPITLIDIISLLGCPTCTPLSVVKVTVFMAYANACVNVFIYAGFNTDMKRTWIDIFWRVKQAVLRAVNGRKDMWIEMGTFS